MPGVDTKRDGVLDVSMFSGEEDVRGHLLRHLGKGAGEGTSSASTDTQAAAGEGAESSVLTEWSLAAHRKKRIRGDGVPAAHSPSAASHKKNKKKIKTASTTTSKEPHLLKGSSSSSNSSSGNSSTKKYGHPLPLATQSPQKNKENPVPVPVVSQRDSAAKKRRFSSTPNQLTQVSIRCHVFLSLSVCPLHTCFICQPIVVHACNSHLF